MSKMDVQCHLDDFRFEADIYVSAGYSVSLTVRDIQVCQPSATPALVTVAGENTLKLY